VPSFDLQKSSFLLLLAERERVSHSILVRLNLKQGDCLVISRVKSMPYISSINLCGTDLEPAYLELRLHLLTKRREKYQQKGAWSAEVCSEVEEIDNEIKRITTLLSQ
jgi:hypothetical protein